MDKSVRALLIPVSGPVIEVEVRSLEELQLHVEGFIEGITLRQQGYAYVNEEGLIRNLPINPRASRLLQRQREDWRRTGGTVRGPMLLLGPVDEAGEHQDVLPFWVQQLQR
jgi:hypothetical protein